MLQQPRLCGLSARARSRVALYKINMQFSEFFLLHCNVKSAPPLLSKFQPAQPSLRMNSAIPNAGGCPLGRTRLLFDGKFESTELPTVLA